ncbi:hypothetical protein [Methylomonas koyamae]|nr:hypothetical protein [Methylomonas koyamae]
MPMNYAIIPTQHVVAKTVGLAAICSYKNNCEVQYMKILKSAVIAFSLAAAMGSFSTAAVAESDPGRVSYKPIDVINEVITRITAAETAINNGAEGDAVVDSIKKAADFIKELNANDKVARAADKARSHLKAAITSAKAANLQETKEHLAAGKQGVEGLKKLL